MNPRSYRLTQSKDNPDDIREAALRLLARREHAAGELQRKLRAKGYAPAGVDEVTAALAREGLLSDKRFTETYVLGRMRRGWGPLRIKAELGERGVDGELVETYIDVNDGQWRDIVRAARSRRFGDRPPEGFQDRARQMRFLQSRGFTADQIKHALASSRGEDEAVWDDGVDEQEP